MEWIQERALRFVFDDLTSSHDILLDRAGVTTLTHFRIKTIAAEVYKSSNDLSPLYIADMFCPVQKLRIIWETQPFQLYPR